MKDQYLNLRAELHFKGRDWLAVRDCNLCGDEKLGAELIRTKYKITSNGKMQAESKEDMKKRGFDSPNRADAFLLTLAVDAVSATHGSFHRIGWAVPLKRAIRGIV
jgi:phage terminase large subunit